MVSLVWSEYSGASPLDSCICPNLLDAARRDKPVSVLKASISAEITKSIIGKFAGPSANLKSIRVACICSLGFAGFFRYDELSTLAPVHLEFFPDHPRVFVPGLKMTFSMGNVDLSSSVALSFSVQ